ncbi:MAG: DUF2806 domain-containing protein [Magnetococcales bacterium]|nr:DUF2806 domain-containing protein [Magnetococcales bacterium]
MSPRRKGPAPELQGLSKAQASLVLALARVTGLAFDASPPPEIPPEVRILLTRSNDAQTGAQRAAHRREQQDILQQWAMERIVHGTLALLAEAPSPSCGEGDSPEPGWLIRFLQGSQGILDPQLQTLWSRLLAQETRHPGRHPMPVLDLLQTLRGEDAARLAAALRLTGFVAPGFQGFPHAPEVARVAESVGLTAGDLPLLQSLGWVQNGPLFVRKPNAPFFWRQANIALRMTPGVRVRNPAATRWTPQGAWLIPLFPPAPPPEEYRLIVSRFFTQCGFLVEEAPPGGEAPTETA